MNDNQFDKLFTYITDMDKRIEGEFAEIKDEIRELRNIPDDVASRFSYITDEQAARDAQFGLGTQSVRENRHPTRGILVLAIAFSPPIC